jgi:hypothetical protein
MKFVSIQRFNPIASFRLVSPLVYWTPVRILPAKRQCMDAFAAQAVHLKMSSPDFEKCEVGNCLTPRVRSKHHNWGDS